MQIAIDAAGFTPAEADELRQAMSAKRSGARMARLSDRLYRRDGRAGHHRGGGRGDRRQVGRLRQLRLPREPRRVLRLSRVLERLAEAALPRRLVRRAAQRAAHGLLVPPVAGGRRPAPRRDRAPAARRPLRRRCHLGVGPRRARRRTRGRAGPPSPPSGWASCRCAGGRGVARRVADHRPYASMEDLVRRTGQAVPSSRRSPRPALSTACPPATAHPEIRDADAGALWAAGALAHATAERLPGLVSGRRPPPSPIWRPRGGGGRHVGHRPHRGAERRRARPAPARRPGGDPRRAAGRVPRPTARYSWVGWSPTASDPRAPRAPCSSTWRTRPAW